MYANVVARGLLRSRPIAYTCEINKVFSSNETVANVSQALTDLVELGHDGKIRGGHARQVTHDDTPQQVVGYCSVQPTQTMR